MDFIDMDVFVGAGWLCPSTLLTFTHLVGRVGVERRVRISSTLCTFANVRPAVLHLDLVDERSEREAAYPPEPLTCDRRLHPAAPSA